jgi:hypothetical protein
MDEQINQTKPSDEKPKTMWVFPQTLQLFLIFFGTGFEVLTVTRIYSVVWIRTPYRLAHGHVCFGETIWSELHRLSEYGYSKYALPKTSVSTS